MSSVEDRLADALGARAELERAEAGLLRQRRTELAATAAEDVTALDTGVDHDDALASVVVPADVLARRRRVVRVLAVAAVVLALAAAAVGVARLAGRSHSAPPAGGIAHSYAGLARPQVPSDTAAAPSFFGDGADAGSVRLLGQLMDRRFYATVDPAGRLCWAVEHRGGDTGGCELETGPAEAVQMSEPDLVDAWLVPDGWDTSDLTRRGLVEAAPSLWLPRNAAGSADEVFSALRRPQATSDAFARTIDPTSYAAGSERVLAKTGDATYWVATGPTGEACLVVLLNQVGSAGSSCRSALSAAVDGLWLGTTGGSVTVEAHLVPDGSSTAGWEQESRVPLAPGLWVDRATGERAAVDQLRAAATDPFAAGPAVATGTQVLEVPAGTWSAPVLVRCLSTSPLVVRVDGEVQGGRLCDGGPGSEPVVRAAGLLVRDRPVTVTITGPAGATWAAGVVDLAAE
ncbi:hypothetical protein ACUN7V_01515 [Quadrisphaera oryzae]|uniref:hypothetical protein n=1 Tax=Quadrisphaera TaxID=317661 RepID=UPI0016492660|nr:hypothetical protein [Quadrisphaera sp. RL12-1S]MBC3762707.1 hypothetical protein [Quadrisphaera sp. RL12-1S]